MECSEGEIEIEGASSCWCRSIPGAKNGVVVNRGRSGILGTRASRQWLKTAVDRHSRFGFGSETRSWQWFESTLDSVPDDQGPQNGGRAWINVARCAVVVVDRWRSRAVRRSWRTREQLGRPLSLGVLLLESADGIVHVG